MRHNLARAMVMAACVLAACDSSGNAAQDTLGTTPPTATLPPVTTGTSAASTAPPTTIVDEGAIGLSPDGPWRRVDSAPGVTLPGLVYELMPGLWVWLPTEEDIPNGITWVLNKDDLPIIEAYLQARLVFFRATESDPIDLDDPGWADWYVDAGAAYVPMLEGHRKLHERFDRAQGVVLRPVVLGEGRTEGEAIVADCMLDGGVWMLPDGSIGSESSPGVAPNGLGAVMVFDGTIWIARSIVTDQDVCS